MNPLSHNLYGVYKILDWVLSALQCAQPGLSPESLDAALGIGLLEAN